MASGKTATGGARSSIGRELLLSFWSWQIDHTLDRNRDSVQKETG
jgi:hypothetical protein